MQKIDQLIHAKWIITCEPNQSPLENHAIAAHQGRILAILPSHEAKSLYEANQEQTLSTHALLPGLINSHTHSAMNMFRGLADDLALMEWLNEHIWPTEGKWVSDELVFDATQLAIAEMIRSGTTCFNDMYFFLDATAKAAELAGIRAHIGMTVIDVPTAWAKTPDEYFKKAIEFYHQYKNHELVTPTLAPHSTYTVSIENLIKVKELADEYQLKINIHLQEDPTEISQSLSKYQKRPLQRLHEIGMVSPDLIAIHMTQINDEDFEILQATRPSIVHCPESNMKLSSGAAPVEKLFAHGLNVSLGTDGAASNNDLNMLGEMRSAAFLAKLVNQNPKSLPAHTVLQMATLNSAKTLGKDKIIGSLAKDKAADFIAINLEEIETQPIFHPISQIVYAASRQQVTDVWVAGQQLLKNRQLLTLDEKEILKKAQIWRNRIKN
jgi:5-methylthioadenosine/S-adenosylhomocysteine deaminase